MIANSKLNHFIVSRAINSFEQMEISQLLIIWRFAKFEVIADFEDCFECTLLLIDLIVLYLKDYKQLFYLHLLFSGLKLGNSWHNYYELRILNFT